MHHEKFTDEQLEAQVDRIMLGFNFENVLEHMTKTEHKWIQNDRRGMKTPTIDELRIEARSLLTKAIYDKHTVINIGTGGFMAYKLPWGMYLAFQIEWAQGN